jgi:catechol 2,3-dioxygenase-like lactoylglutathione lyase family enzyme
MTLKRMDNVLIVVEDLEAAKAFFVELGIELEGETLVEGLSVDNLTGLKDVRATLTLLRTPDGHGRIELDKFHTPAAVRGEPQNAPVNTLGIRRIMFAVDDINDVVAHLPHLRPRILRAGVSALSRRPHPAARSVVNEQ